MDIIKEISAKGIIPLVTLDSLEDALPLVSALSSGGLNIAEITFRTNVAEQAIRLITEKLRHMLVGAGTIINPDQVVAARNAGAKFIVTPGFNPRVVDKCLEIGMPIIPGCASASQIEQALERGLRIIKFFPAELSGGLRMIDALSEVFPMVKFLPTGGINLANLNDYLRHPKVLAVADNFMLNQELIKQGRLGEITYAARSAVNTMLGLRINHIAINSNPQEADRIVKLFCAFLDAEIPDDGKYSGGIIEVVRNPQREEKGHIAFGTNSIERALHYLVKRGFTVDQQSVRRTGSGQYSFAAINEQIGGFSLHLVRE